MPSIYVANLEARAAAAGLDLAGLGDTANLSHAEVTLLARGDVVSVREASVQGLAGVLGLRPADLVMPTLAKGGRAQRHDDAEEASDPAMDQCSVPPFEAALNAVMTGGGGQYTEDDRDLVMGALSQGEMPSQVSLRELPALAREWLDGAAGLRGASDDPVSLLLARMADEQGDASRTARRMATRTVQRLAALALAAKAMARKG